MTSSETNALRNMRHILGRFADGMNLTTHAVDRMEALGRKGITISVACGPCGADPFRWTVQCLSPTGEEFARPFAATSFAHAIEIAELEARRWCVMAYQFDGTALERCDGRYPVPQTSPPRDEPFDVTYRCALPKGHDGPHSSGAELP